MFAYAPLIPILTLLSGALIICLLHKLLRTKDLGLVALVTVSVAWAAAILLYQRKPQSLTLSHWQAILPAEGALSYYVDDLAATFLLLILYLGLAGIFASLESLTAPSETISTLLAPMLLLLAGGASLFLAGNLLTLYLSWGLLDLAFLLGIVLAHRGELAGRAAARATGITYLAGLAILAALMKNWESSPYQWTASPPFSVAALLSLAALVRVGIYPAHLWLPEKVKMPGLLAMLLYSASIGTGLYLLLRVHSLSEGALPWGDVILMAGALSLVISALLTWRRTQPRETVFYLITNQASYVILSLALCSSGATTIATLQVLNLLLSSSILLLWERRKQPATFWAKAPPTLAILSLLGLPLTPGFTTRWLLYQSALNRGQEGYVALGAIATFLTFLPLLRFLHSGGREEKGEGELSNWMALVLLAIPLLLLGFHPSLIISSPEEAASLPSFLNLLSLSSHKISILASISFPIFGGYLLHRLGPVFSENLASLLGILCQIADLRWLYGLLEKAFLRARAVLRTVGMILVEERSLGWTLLWGLVVILFLMKT